MIKFVYEFTIEDRVLREMYRDDEADCSFEEYVENLVWDMDASDASELACDSDASVKFCD